MRALLFALSIATCVPSIAAESAIDGTTATGERVRLFPDGRWEYVDAKKAAAQQPAIEAYQKQKHDERAREQGGLFGVGRTIKPGDADYNRGSLGGK